MQPVEALRTLIDLGVARLKSIADQAATTWGLDQNDIDEEERLKEATVLCESFFSAALPIARFQCMVTIEKIGQKSKLGLGDYTVCGLTIPSIKNALVGLSMEKVSVYVRLWERHQQGSEMLSGYQGETKCLQFRNWLADIDRWEPERTRQEIEVGRGPQG